MAPRRLTRKEAEQVAHLLNTQNNLAIKYKAGSIAASKSPYLVAILSGRVLGCVCIEKVSYHLSEIKHLSVDKRFQGRGIGHYLVKRALRACKTHYVYATVRKDNEASKNLFLNLGFKCTSSIDGVEPVYLLTASTQDI